DIFKVTKSVPTSTRLASSCVESDKTPYCIFDARKFHYHVPLRYFGYFTLLSVRAAFYPNVLTNHECVRVHRGKPPVKHEGLRERDAEIAPTSSVVVLGIPLVSWQPTPCLRPIHPTLGPRV